MDMEAGKTLTNEEHKNSLFDYLAFFYTGMEILF